MPESSDLAHLFPNLAAQFDSWDGKVQNDGHDDPNHGGVTDEDIESYLTQMGALRAPLAPVVSGQQAPQTPEFYNNGRPVPPGGQAVTEPAQQEEIPGSVDGSNQEEAPEGAVTPPPAPPVPPAPAAEPDEYVINGQKYNREQAAAWARFDQMVQADPNLRNTIAQYMQQRANPGAATPVRTPVTPSLPDLPPEYEDDEYIKALHNTLKMQQEVLARVDRQSQFAAETVTQQTQRTYADIAQGAMTEFKTSRNLDDATMAAVSGAAHRSGIAEKYMQGYDPITGTPVQPDPYRAVMKALEVGYLMTPETRQLEIQRAVEAESTRATKDATRKQKLGGVSGAAGSVPRTQSVPRNPQDARTAMVSEVANMMNGSWPGDGS